MSCGVFNPSGGAIRGMAVGWNRRESLAQRKMLGSSEQRQQDQQGDDGGLRQDGDDERAAANAAFAAALLGIAFDETASQGTEGFLRNGFRDTSGNVRHRALPQFFLRGFAGVN